MPAVDVFFQYIAESEDFHQMRTLAESAEGAARNCRNELRVLMAEAKFEGVEPDAFRVEILNSEIVRWDNIADATRHRLFILPAQDHAETDPVPACENDPWWDEADHAKDPW